MRNMCGPLEDVYDELMLRLQEVVRKYQLTFEDVKEILSSTLFNLKRSKKEGFLKDNFGIEERKK